MPTPFQTQRAGAGGERGGAANEDVIVVVAAGEVVGAAAPDEDAAAVAGGQHVVAEAAVNGGPGRDVVADPDRVAARRGADDERPDGLQAERADALAVERDLEALPVARDEDLVVVDPTLHGERAAAEPQT